MSFPLFHKPLFRLLLLIILPAILPMNQYEGFQTSGCDLTPSEFKESIKDGKVFTLFYANWCGHCTKPTWETAAKTGNVNDEIKMVMVDLGDKDDLAQEQLRKEYNIRGYPTIVDLKAENKDYTGDRSVSAFVTRSIICGPMY